MKKNTVRILIMILSILVIVTLPIEAVERTFYFFRNSGIGVRQVEFYLRVGMTELLVCLLYAIAVIVFFVNLFKLIFSSGDQQTDGLNQPRKKAKAAADSFAAKPAQQSRESSAGAEIKGDKYLEQLNGFLESGLVTREEYQQLRERYYRSNRKG